MRIGIVAFGKLPEELTMYSVGEGSASVHRFKGKGLREVRDLLGLELVLIRQQDNVYPYLPNFLRVIPGEDWASD